MDTEMLHAEELVKRIKALKQSLKSASDKRLMADLLELVKLSKAVATTVSGYSLDTDADEAVSVLYSFLS